MAIINVRSLVVTSFAQATTTDIDIVRNDQFRFPNVTYCFDGLPELPGSREHLSWSPHSNDNYDAPGWLHALTPYVQGCRSSTKKPVSLPKNTHRSLFRWEIQF